MTSNTPSSPWSQLLSCMRLDTCLWDSGTIAHSRSGSPGSSACGPMYAQTTLMAVKLANNLGSKARPVAIKDFSFDEMLQFHIARGFKQPVAMRFKAAAIKCRSKDRE